MIRDKEYPATHSMSTAWYMVDADGNIGLMEFQDNGPVPELKHVGLDLSLNDLPFGEVFSNDGKCIGIHLTESQINELLGEPMQPEEVENWFDICLAISPESTEEFLTLCQNKDVTNRGCISTEMNLYCTDVFHCIDFDNDKIIRDSTLDKMIRSGIIRAVYQITQLDVNDDYNPKTDSVEFTKIFENSPYYIYCQSYCTRVPQHRMNIPSNPVKITQVDEEFRNRMLHIPIRFSDAEDIQIAQWFVCNPNKKNIAIDDAGYSLFPIDKHTAKYCLTTPFLFDFFNYCPDKGHYKCGKCNNNCASTARYINSLTPTVLYIADPKSYCNLLNHLDLPTEIKNKIAIFRYIPKFPHKEPGYGIYIDKMKKYMTDEILASLLSYSHSWFERVVQTINPQVIVIDDEALSVFSSVYSINEKEVAINNVSYPIFKASTVKDNQERIITLAKAPYRGKTFRMTYTVQEVENLKCKGHISEFEL